MRRDELSLNQVQIDFRVEAVYQIKKTYYIGLDEIRLDRNRKKERQIDGQINRQMDKMDTYYRNIAR